jgi:tRNA U38,U39,U40 pseudouridine synthase TruA
LKLAVDTRVDSEARAENEKISAKRKMALTLGYVGTKYYGLQIDTKNNISTVEKAILQALLSAGCVSERNAEDLVKIGWSRSSRTDKGESTLRLKLPNLI